MLLSESLNYSRYDNHLVNCFSLCRQQPATPSQPIDDENNHMESPSNETVEW
jgi:hypothetical protein